MRNIDLSSWQGLLTTVIGLALVTLIGLGIRLVFMMTVQQRQQRLNRQINERLKTLIAAYKVLGGSFTGNLSVDPAHKRELRQASEEAAAEAQPADDGGDGSVAERRRRIRDAVEASLSDIILLGTEEQVRLAATAASELAAGRPVHTHDLVVSLRTFIRKALDLEAIPSGLTIPEQGPTRPSSAGGGGRGRQGAGGGDNAGREGGAGGGGGMGSGGGGMGMGMGLGMGAGRDDDTPPPHKG